eukprot:CAMPEP_0203911782 /NCGR_PEP_ID=MMETSP0359-20131031/52919_1 /ASSEMBLY_ACC=CAM_ASM_000338 /TAXON_ID=268821 /ORGANISM="Scrippsiella Hangoei, Strain SHTV-5" /LENGTH=80 /DNA_ID=CAMNT_0050837569 /DNA_START=200 /DNA_END=439 /DNA_ORIENTATION=+
MAKSGLHPAQHRNAGMHRKCCNLNTRQGEQAAVNVDERSSTRCRVCNGATSLITRHSEHEGGNIDGRNSNRRRVCDRMQC